MFTHCILRIRFAFADSSFSKSLARVFQLLVLCEESLARGHQRNWELLDASTAELTRLDDCTAGTSNGGSDCTLNECAAPFLSFPVLTSTSTCVLTQVMLDSLDVLVLVLVGSRRTSGRRRRAR